MGLTVDLAERDRNHKILSLFLFIIIYNLCMVFIITFYGEKNDKQNQKEIFQNLS